MSIFLLLLLRERKRQRERILVILQWSVAPVGEREICMLFFLKDVFKSLVRAVKICVWISLPLLCESDPQFFDSELFSLSFYQIVP